LPIGGFEVLPVLNFKNLRADAIDDVTGTVVFE
jgi:hypothetical protein